MWTQLCPGLYYYFCWICFQRFGFLLKFNFQVQAGRKLAPTTLGITLIRGYQCIDPDLCLPDIRSFIEQQITLVAKGQADHSGVVQHVLQQFRQKYSYYVKQVRESYIWYPIFMYIYTVFQPTLVVLNLLWIAFFF